ncbi:MAG: type II toxin-antitoxin system VapC family toxin [Fulvimarina manganoxydans]|uniref:type II toxin-antitoxin system VapC family toxin n=1 Tax=Fulvimarina manganoxydans TaxID=937218 RepID=UPI0023541BFC|nr:type II toxin-antitoxin system VapC family toxin [Fulvimarina manganoxydans]MCK5930617.1 type II toxin-antitoxin system VapC family toxin [Fulvimarina manganoxydans]
MRYCLDTNVVIALFKGNPRVVSALTRVSPSDIALSAVVLHELYYGAFKSQRVETNLARIEALRFSTLPFSISDARLAGQVRALVASQPIGPYDIFIAAQALNRGPILVTRNNKEFGRVPGLAVEDWESEIER